MLRSSCIYIINCAYVKFLPPKSYLSLHLQQPYLHPQKTIIQFKTKIQQLSAIMECADAAHGLNGLVVGDGGCTCPGDVAKASSSSGFVSSVRWADCFCVWFYVWVYGWMDGWMD